MGFVGIDVGVTTGVALLSSEGKVLMTFKIHAADLETSPLAVWAEEHEHRVCVEYPQPSLASSTAFLRYATDAVRRLYPDAFTVRPGIWKESAIAHSPLPDEVQGLRLSAHEKDAINIARWYRAYTLIHDKR